MVGFVLLCALAIFETAERRASILIFGNDYELKDRRRVKNCPSRKVWPQ